MALRVERVPTLSDNYSYVLVCEQTGEAAIVDWLKQDFDLGHGHAMSIVAYIKGKRN